MGISWAGLQGGSAGGGQGSVYMRKTNTSVKLIQTPHHWLIIKCTLSLIVDHYKKHQSKNPENKINNSGKK
ncbi:MAG: hypothetical protein ABN482_01225 [Corticimicrobacter sp.]|uniref:hypothetical protein n=1 Tax=Corticimicrobacter sp. TaxID=2678536 RepID=UPI0032DAED2A